MYLRPSLLFRTGHWLGVLGLIHTTGPACITFEFIRHSQGLSRSFPRAITSWLIGLNKGTQLLLLISNTLVEAKQPVLHRQCVRESVRGQNITVMLGSQTRELINSCFDELILRTWTYVVNPLTQHSLGADAPCCVCLSFCTSVIVPPILSLYPR